MTWSAIGGAVVSYGLNSMNNTAGNNAAAAGMADPFAAQRPMYQSMLSGEMNGTQLGTVGTTAFKNAESNSLGSVDRSLAASGGAGSGGERAALMQTGAGMELAQHNQDINQLTTLSGANQGSPAEAGKIMADYNNNTAAGLGQLGNTIGGGLVNWWSTPSATPTPTVNI